MYLSFIDTTIIVMNGEYANIKGLWKGVIWLCHDLKKKFGSMNLEIVACATAMAAPSTSPVIVAIVNDFDYHDYYNNYYENFNHDGTSWSLLQQLQTITAIIYYCDGYNHVGNV